MHVRTFFHKNVAHIPHLPLQKHKRRDRYKKSVSDSVEVSPRPPDSVFPVNTCQTLDQSDPDGQHGGHQHQNADAPPYQPQIHT